MVAAFGGQAILRDVREERLQLPRAVWEPVAVLVRDDAGRLGNRRTRELQADAGAR